MTGGIEDEANKRIGEAEEDKALRRAAFNDIYKICMPWRRRIGVRQPIEDEDEIFDQTAQETLSDFAPDLQDTITPLDDDWVILEPNPNLSKADQAEIAPSLAQIQNIVFTEIRRSNFNEAALEAYPDLALGTCSMCIQDLGALTEPIHCLAVPIPDLLLGRGVYGGVDFRARDIVAMKRRDLPVNYSYAMTDDLLRQAEADPGGTVCVKECWWRLWDKPNYGERWQFALLVDGKMAHAAEFEGDGSCSLIAGRWKTDSTTAWGIGPFVTTLPAIKTLETLSYLVLTELSYAASPMRAYDQDNVMNPENAAEPGKWFPRAPGSKIDTLGSGADFDTTFFSREQMQATIKRALFQDGPQQTGDTPPTLGQWMDQKASKARRQGSPLGRLKTEWQLAIFQRFVYLLQKRGEIPKGFSLRHPKVKVSVQSPVIQAARQQKVAIASQLVQGIVAMLGPQAQMVLDGKTTAQNMQALLGDKVVAFNSDEQIQAMLQKIAAASQPPQPGQVPPPQPQGAP